MKREPDGSLFVFGHSPPRYVISGARYYFSGPLARSGSAFRKSIPALPGYEVSLVTLSKAKPGTCNVGLHCAVKPNLHLNPQQIF
jgi:hypothetical protein